MTQVMIVDDDLSTVSLLRTLLELDGFAVQTATRGGDVLPMIEAERPDVVLMDYHLLDVDGVDVLRALRAHPTLHTLPVVMTSGLAVGDEVRQAGADDFLLKPFEPSALAGLFHRLAEGRPR